MIIDATFTSVNSVYKRQTEKLETITVLTLGYRLFIDANFYANYHPTHFYRTMVLFITKLSNGSLLLWSLFTLYLHACQVRVTVGDSGLCCCTCVTYIERESTPLCVDSEVLNV